MMGSAESWDRITQTLVANEYRVVALDLPGHGLSPRDPATSVHTAADAVIDTVRSLLDAPPTVAMGHSYGASVLGVAAARLQSQISVYVDAGLTVPGGYDATLLTAQYEEDRQRRTAQWLSEHRAYSGPAAIAAEARAAERFDPASAASVSSGDDLQWQPAPGSIVVRADPSAWVSDADAVALAAEGCCTHDLVQPFRRLRGSVAGSLSPIARNRGE